MIYLSKGIPIMKTPAAGVSVSHCGRLHKLTGEQAALWQDVQYRVVHVSDPLQADALRAMSDLGIIECGENNDDSALFRILTNCAICPVHVRRQPSILTGQERSLLRWIRRAGLRLTMAELVFLVEHGIKPVSGLLGEDNRQPLTEIIYTTETIPDGILEVLMEAAAVRDAVVQSVLGLLRKKKIYLI